MKRCPLSLRPEGRNPPQCRAGEGRKPLKSAIHQAKLMGNRMLIPQGRTGTVMRSFCAAAAAALLTIAAAPPSESAPAGPALTYADLADLGLASPVAAHVRVAKAVALKGAQAAGVRPGLARFYVEADLVSLIRGAQGHPTRV